MLENEPDGELERTTDPYTSETQSWLDDRFRQVDGEGVYFAHQPIYGFRAGRSEPWLLVRYIITYQIMRALGHLRFSSLVDIGGAEGYKAALVRQLFGAEVYSCDLSTEACRRAREIYGVDGEVVDVRALPFADREFDVVLCSETLEHVPDLEGATRELLRVARRAVVITVPREDEETVAGYRHDGIPHAHLHALHAGSFDFTRPSARRIEVRRFLSPLLKPAFVAVDAMPKEEGGRLPGWAVRWYNRSVPLLRILAGKRAASALVHLDGAVARLLPGHQGLLFVLVKDEASWVPQALRRVSPREVIDFCVPLHRPGHETPAP